MQHALGRSRAARHCQRSYEQVERGVPSPRSAFRWITDLDAASACCSAGGAWRYASIFNTHSRHGPRRPGARPAAAGARPGPPPPAGGSVVARRAASHARAARGRSRPRGRVGPARAASCSHQQLRSNVGGPTAIAAAGESFKCVRRALRDGVRCQTRAGPVRPSRVCNVGYRGYTCPLPSRADVRRV